MTEFFVTVIEANGGMDHCKGFQKVEANVVGGGGFFRFEGMPQDSEPWLLTVWLNTPRMTLSYLGSADQKAVFMPERVSVEKTDGSAIAERNSPRDAFAGYQMNTPWDPRHQGYFSGEAFWAYFTVLFLLAADGVQIEEIEPWQERSETWRILRAHFPSSIKTHCHIQEFFPSEDFMLRRLDYTVDVAGGFGAAQIISGDVTANGFRLPTKRRAHMRTLNRKPTSEMLMVSIDISNVRFT